ncbi:MAG: hypothetical protein LBQ34_05790, partial [Alphaproteobacteria bacterium]|nr:hypothetical protein [Alphaproteobacteria bacterium]
MNKNNKQFTLYKINKKESNKSIYELIGHVLDTESNITNICSESYKNNTFTIITYKASAQNPVTPAKEEKELGEARLGCYIVIHDTGLA